MQQQLLLAKILAEKLFQNNFYQYDFCSTLLRLFFYFHKKAPNNAYSFYVHPLGNFGVGQGADGFAINTNYLDGINFQPKLKL